MTKIGTFYFAFLIILYFYFFKQPLLLWIASFSTLILIPIILFFIKQYHQQQFYSEFLRFLSLVILSMQRGLSFQASLENALVSCQWKQDQILRSLCDHVVFSQQGPVVEKGRFGQFIKQIRCELIRVNQHQHQAIDRLCNFRKNIRDRLIFRQKSRQIWFYFSYQVTILSVIYLAILIFILREYGFFDFQFSFLLSFTLFLIGIAVTYWLTRSKKWFI